MTTPTSKPRLSPRRRRLRITFGLLAATVLVGGTVGVFVYMKNRPTQYRPDEQMSDITSSLARNLPPDAPKPRFTDVTAEARLGSFRTFTGERTSQLPEDVGSGAAWGDFDNDGDDDLFLTSAGGALNVPTEKLAPCELHENLGDGTFRKVAGFPDARIHGMGAAWGDYNGDGRLDLAVTGYDALLLFRNEGDGNFSQDQRLPNRRGFWSGAAWGDYDNDRALDLYVCGYVQYVAHEADVARGSTQGGTFVPFTLNPSSYPGETNLLFHNEGDGTFTEVGAEQNVQNPEGRSLGALWHDFDDDGWLDLYVANDISDNVFYRNVGGKFTNFSHPALVADYRSAMGLTAGDYDRDGDDDLFISHWVAQENALYENLWSDLRNQRTAATATGPTNRYPLRFMDIADMKGLGQIALPFVGWGTEFADFDGDGWLDIIVANGNTLEFPGPLPRKLKPQACFFFWNRRGEFFHDLAPLNKSLAEEHNSRALALSDYDEDGDLDVVLTHLGEGVQLLRNDMQTGNWLKVRLRSVNKRGHAVGFADGAKVIAHVDNTSLRRTVSSVSYLSQSTRTLHFGLGSASLVDRLEIRWHAGLTNVFEKMENNATYEITEGAPLPKRVLSRNKMFTQSAPAAQPTRESEKARLVEFWQKQRAAMNAMKVEKDNAKAIGFFREALALDPRHEDSRYYLGLCLASQGDAQGALGELDELRRINPQSHRAWQQWGVLRAAFATCDAHLAAAEHSLERAHALNPEETGALLVLGEISILRGQTTKARQQLEAACHTNPKAIGGFFLRAYLAWKQADNTAAVRLLEQGRAALGKDWQPSGATAEGDVKQKQHVETTPLTRFWERWDGAPEPGRAFAILDGFLATDRLSKQAAAH